jgi:cob(I)alamin adenosyltransferase
LLARPSAPLARDAGTEGLGVSSRKPDEPVRLTKIYTRGGDKGETSLGDGSRVSKLDPLVRAYGAVDELNSVVGWAQVEARDTRLARVQNDLFDLGADLSVPYAEEDGKLRVTQEQIDALERDCDEANEPLEPLKSFVLPGGNETAARLHVARAVCRRAESVALWAADERPVNPLALVYLNRLSDLIFILARAATAGGEEPLWKPGGPGAT